MNSSISNQPADRPFIPPLLGLALGVLAASTAAIFIRYAQGSANSLVVAAFRLSFAALMLAPVALARHRQEIMQLGRKELLLAVVSGFFLAIHFATWISSLAYTSVASSVVLVTTTPLWVALLAPVTLRESITRLVWVGMGLALLGGVVVGVSDTCSLSTSGIACPPLREFIQGQAFIGDVLALVGAMMGGAYLIIGRRLRSQMSLIGYIFIVYSMAALVLVILAVSNCLLWSAGDPGCRAFWGYPPLTYLWFFLLAAVPQLIGHSSFNWALRYLSVAYVSITLLGEPIGSTLLAFFLLKEQPTGLKIFGAILILLGIYIASQSERRVVANKATG